MLSDVRIRAAKAAEKPYKLADSNRMYLYVSTTGAKSWRLDYSFGGKNLTLSLGQYPQIGLQRARELRDEARQSIRDGMDPRVARKLSAQAKADAAQMTFEVVAREWHRINTPQWAKVHARDVIASLKRDVFKEIGFVPITDIQAPMILTVLRKVEARGAIETAKRLRQRISGVFEYAMATGLAKADPAAKVGAALLPLPPKGRQPAITDLDEFRKMLAAVEADYARPITKLAMRLIALTAVRSNELRGATWNEFEDLEGSDPIWRIPASRMKGDRNRKVDLDGDHIVPLAPAAVAVLQTAWTITGHFKLVFPNARNMNRPMSENALGYLLNQAGYKDRHVPHGFRASFSTIMNEWAKRCGRSDDRAIIDLMLAHVPSNKVEKVYNRAGYMLRRRAIANQWAKMIARDLPEPESLLLSKRQRPNAEGGARGFRP